MLKLCLKIWAVANLLVFFVFGLALLAQNPTVGFTALLYSSGCSLPAIGLLYGVLLLLRLAQGGIWFSWAVLLMGTAFISLTAYGLFRMLANDGSSELDFVFPLCFVCGYSAVLLFASPLHSLFEKFYFSRYENN